MERGEEEEEEVEKKKKKKKAGLDNKTKTHLASVIETKEDDSNFFFPLFQLSKERQKAHRNKTKTTTIRFEC